MAERDTNLMDSNTVSKTTDTKPGDIIDVNAAVGELADVAEKLSTKNDLASKTNLRNATDST